MPNALVTSEHMNIILNNYARMVGVTLTPYDTGAPTVTRADLAQRLYDLTPASVAAKQSAEQKQREDQQKIADYDELKKENDELQKSNSELKEKASSSSSSSSSGSSSSRPRTRVKTQTVYIDESMKDSEVLLPQRVHVTATGKAGCTAGESAAEHAAHTSEGWIMGYNDRGVYTFKGVNYATARRFENPKPAQYGRSGFSSLYSDDEDRPTLAMVRGAASPQAKTNTVYSDYFGFAYFMTPAGEDMFGRESDCLNLNIWTSSLNENAKKPILVFMHGGGTDSDAATGLEVYEGRDFAEHNDIVFVTVNARLGTLGYGRDFTAIGGGNNLAVRDMLLSLEWVKENAETFGGDPNNITIAGQSGGGSKVSYLIDSKYADDNDLFQKVVAISASLGSNVTRSQEDQNTRTLNFADSVVSNGHASSRDAVLSYLQGVRSDELGDALDGYNGAQTIDGYIFDNQSACWGEDSINERAAQYDYLIGNTWSEMVGRDSIEVIQSNMYTRAKGYMSEDAKMELMEELFADRERSENRNYYGMTEITPASTVPGTMDEIRTAFHDLFPDHDFYDLRTLVAGEQGGFTRDNYYNSSMRVSKGQEDHNTGKHTYEYLMAYEFPYFGGTAMYHTGDLAFWFYSLGNVRYQISGDEENAYKVADYCANALTNFCETGDPSANGIDWLPHEEDNAYCMIVDNDTRLVNGDYGEELIQLSTRVPTEEFVPITLGEDGSFPAGVNAEDVAVSFMGMYLKPDAGDIEGNKWVGDTANLCVLRPVGTLTASEEATAEPSQGETPAEETPAADNENGTPTNEGQDTETGENDGTGTNDQQVPDAEIPSDGNTTPTGNTETTEQDNAQADNSGTEGSEAA